MGISQMRALGWGARRGLRSLPLGLVLCWGNLLVQVLGLDNAGLFSGWSQYFLWAFSHPQSQITLCSISAALLVFTTWLSADVTVSPLDETQFPGSDP